MKKHYLTETERMVLKHTLGFSINLIEHFENLDLDDKTRDFLIFEMMVKLKEREQKKVIEKSKKESFFKRMFK